MVDFPKLLLTLKSWRPCQIGNKESRPRFSILSLESSLTFPHYGRRAQRGRHSCSDGYFGGHSTSALTKKGALITLPQQTCFLDHWRLPQLLIRIITSRISREEWEYIRQNPERHVKRPRIGKVKVKEGCFPRREGYLLCQKVSKGSSTHHH